MKFIRFIVTFSKIIKSLFLTSILILNKINNKMLTSEKNENEKNDELPIESISDEKERLMAQKLTLFDEFEFYKQSYYYEIDIQEKLNARATTFFSLLPLLISVLLYFYKDTFKIFKRILDFPISIGIYFFFLAALTIIFICLVSKLYTTIHGNKYSYTPTLKDIYDYKNTLIEEYHYTSEGVDIEMKNFLTESLVNSTTVNKLTNHKKIDSFRGNTNLLCIFLVVAVAVFFLHINLDSKKPSEKIHEKPKVIYVRE